MQIGQSTPSSGFNGTTVVYDYVLVFRISSAYPPKFATHSEHNNSSKASAAQKKAHDSTILISIITSSTTDNEDPGAAIHIHSSATINPSSSKYIKICSKFPLETDEMLLRPSTYNNAVRYLRRPTHLHISRYTKAISEAITHVSSR